MDMPVSDVLPDWVNTAPLSCDDPVARARALRPIIAAAAAEGDSQGQITDRAVQAIAEAGLFGIQVPRSYGGMELAAHDYFDVIEELSYADGSTGWSIMAIASATLGASRGLAPSAVQTMFGSGAPVNIAGQISKLGKAEVVDGGYRVSGQFSFASGSRYANWFLAAFGVQKEGKPVLTDDGKPSVVVGFVPRSGVRLLGNWDVMGLAGTGSYDFEILEQFMSQDFVGDLDLLVSAPIGHGAWCVGVARRALDEIKALSQRKRRFGRATMIDQQLFQHRFGQNYAAVSAAREIVRKATADWEDAVAAGTLDMETRAKARLVQCWATTIAAQAVDFAYHAAGSDGLRNDNGQNVIQRCFRDIHAGTQHRQIDDNIVIDCATVLLGVDVPGLKL